MSHKGWHSRHYLPHFDSQDVIQFVTFRLVDSLPADALERLQASDRPETLRHELLDRDAQSRPCALHCAAERAVGTDRQLVEALHGPPSESAAGSKRALLADGL